ncbi:NT_PAP_TUTase domain-containing protein [Spironucleus salmonicida]|uniref:NT_PAP_TUTase domain-containing protein n=1 Tax=Spironucleus salmonicida TaxID=348837 RepID=V6LDQ3_9EUKA|nr:NT_PAP_TUTase domain-containing protein [Spironucleus salmonicida]|eukprot:EST41811.1 hypothetical protein SS50377_18645 [Spironucleus salmonicida]
MQKSDANMVYIKSVQNLQYITERIDDLISIVGPSTKVQCTRQTLFQELASLITKELPTAVILPYGSFQSHCYLFNSDIDFCCWNKDEEEQVTARRVLKVLSGIELQNLVHIDAEVPVIKFTYQDVGFDISFTQPAGVLTAYFLELIDNYIGKNHLLKRSLVFIQCYCINELHILGSHNFMLSSYGLRTLVIFILLHQSQITTPLQALYAFLAYFSSFDFSQNLITIFGAVPREDFESCDTAQSFFDKQVSQFVHKKFNDKELQLAKEIKHLIALRVASDGNILEQKGLKNCLQNYKKSDQNRQEYSAQCQEFFQYLDEKIILQDENISNTQFLQALSKTLDEFVRSALLIKFFQDQKPPFQFRSVNIADPLLPSNNIGKTVSESSMKRMKRVFQLGYYNIQRLIKLTLDGQNSVADCVAEFDLNFVHTLSICNLEMLARHADNDCEVLQGNKMELQNASISVVYQGLGMTVHMDGSE